MAKIRGRGQGHLQAYKIWKKVVISHYTCSAIREVCLELLVSVVGLSDFTDCRNFYLVDANPA